ncbi:MAG: AAA family ATPase [Bacteroidales bacterium]|nr:AAA family ATPase [Bacteroidales bacterium]
MFKTKFTAKLNEGLTVIVGENGTGKSAIIDSIRFYYPKMSLEGLESGNLTFIVSSLNNLRKRWIKY